MAQEMEEQKQIKISHKIVKPVLLQWSGLQGIIRLTLQTDLICPRLTKKLESRFRNKKRPNIFRAYRGFKDKRESK